MKRNLDFNMAHAKIRFPHDIDSFYEKIQTGFWCYKLALGEKNLASRGPTAHGRTRFFALWLIFENFSTLGMKKFPYLKTDPFGNPRFNIQTTLCH